MAITRREFLKLAAVGGLSLLIPGSEAESPYLPSLPERPIRSEQAVFFIMPDKIDGDFKSWGGTLREINSFETAVGHRVHGLSFFCRSGQKTARPEYH